MKTQILGVLALALFFISFTSAEIIEQEDIEIAGITPDSPLYVLDVGLERITETFSEKAKFRHAKEKISEIKMMINENKTEEAQEGMRRFEQVRKRVRNQTMLKEHKEFVDNLGQRISQIASQGKLTEEERNQIKELILEHKERIRVEEELIENQTMMNFRRGSN